MDIASVRPDTSLMRRIRAPVSVWFQFAEDNNGSYTYICKLLLYGSAEHTKKITFVFLFADINECNRSMALCPYPHQICINEEGSYRCECDEETTGFNFFPENCYIKLLGLA